MHDAEAHQLVLTYVQGWIAADREQILGTLDPACVIIESYGPTYRGKDMIARWIDSWFAPGNIVTRWDVTSFFATHETCFFEWMFECRFAGHLSGFEGASLAQVSQGKITAVLQRFTREDAMGVKSHFLLRLGNQSKQAGNEGNLSRNVPFSTPCICPLRRYCQLGNRTEHDARIAV